MDWPAFTAALGATMVAATGLIAVVAKLLERRRERLKREGREVDAIWHAVHELAARVKALETADIIERHDRDERTRRASRP